MQKLKVIIPAGTDITSEELVKALVSERKQLKPDTVFVLGSDSRQPAKLEHHVQEFTMDELFRFVHTQKLAESTNFKGKATMPADQIDIRFLSDAIKSVTDGKVKVETKSRTIKFNDLVNPDYILKGMSEYLADVPQEMREEIVSEVIKQTLVNYANNYSEHPEKIVRF